MAEFFPSAKAREGIKVAPAASNAVNLQNLRRSIIFAQRYSEISDENDKDKNLTFADEIICGYSRKISVTSQEFENLAYELRPMLVAQACRLLSDKEGAEDCVQDCFVKLWKMREQIDGVRSVRALATVIVRNQCLDVLKRPANKSASLEDVDTRFADVRMPDYLLEVRDDATAVREMMEELPGNVRTVMKMRHIQGLEVTEISESTGLSVESVRVNISRGRKRLRELFEKRI